MLQQLRHVFNNKRLVRTLSGINPKTNNLYFPFKKFFDLLILFEGFPLFIFFTLNNKFFLFKASSIVTIGFKSL